jgi:methyl-accepting chemotaxis protein
MYLLALIKVKILYVYSNENNAKRRIFMKKSQRLSDKVLLFASIVVVLIVGLVIGILYMNTNNSVEGAIGRDGVSKAQTIASLVDVEAYKKLIDSDDAKSTLYKELREELNTLRIHNGLLYAYVLYPPTEGENLKFLVDGLPLDEEMAGAMGDPSEVLTYKDGQKAIDKNGYYSAIQKSETYGSLMSAITPLKDSSGNTVAFVGVDMMANDVQAVQSDVLKHTIPYIVIILLIGGVILIGIIRFYTNRLLQPLVVLKDVAEQFADGDIRSAEKGLDAIKVAGNNEISAFAKAFTQSMYKLKETFHLIHGTAVNLQQAIGNIHTSTGTVSSSNSEVANSIVTIASGSEQQRANNEEVVRAMEEMVSGIQRMADATSNVAESSNDITDRVQTGVADSENVVFKIHQVEKSVLATSDHVTEMGKQFRSIEEMVAVITSIADQTNLLALNAAIEAARAGEAGKGFAVVADEVRKLAEMSRVSAENIQNQLQSFSITTTKALEEMQTSATSVKDGSEEVGKIGQALVMILQGVQSVNQEIQENSAIIEQMSASSEEVLASAEQMNNVIIMNANRAESVAQASDQQMAIVHDLESVVEELENSSKKMFDAINHFKI